jgi:hypothetical protein
MWKKNRRMIKRLALSLAAAATLVPTAQARVDEIGTSVESETAYPTSVQPADRVEQFALRHVALTGSVGDLAIRPDDRAARFSPSDSVNYVAVGGREGRFIRTDAIGISLVATRPDDRADRFIRTDAIGTSLVASRPDDRALRPMLQTATDYLGRPAAVILAEGPKWEGNKPVDKVVVSGDGFDWADAGIGAGTLFGAVLLAGAALLLVRGNGRLASV